MNLDKFFTWIVSIVIIFAAIGKLDILQTWIWRAQAKVVYRSRTSTWGSPRFFPPEYDRAKTKSQTSKVKPNQF